ncbi:uncharacterized protein LOC134277126 [Saccostrea cucullata]|uniref:uncharacterized protein LOC134277126 n=1 Tax=Saccostrea cuccullata TaxID=36930 RepID=UPI002ED02026
MVELRCKTKKKILTAKSARLKDQLKETYTIQDKEVKKSARKDMKDYVDKLAQDAENTASKQDMGALYRITKSLSAGFKSTDTPVRKQDGVLASSIEEELICWKEHFERVLNQECLSTEHAEIIEAIDTLDIDTNTPTIEEVKHAIKLLKNGKAPGIDQVHAEMLKAEKVLTPRLLTDILQTIWQTETAPDDWKVGLMVKLPKKEESNERNATLYANSIDFAKAFDSIHRPALWMILRHHDIPNKIISIIQMLYKDFQAKVICGTELTESFPIQTGSLEDLDFADDIALLSQRYKDIQSKTDDLVKYGRQIGLKINVNKTKLMKINTKIGKEVTANNNRIEEVDNFIYLGSKITANGDSTMDVENRISKVRAIFAKLRNIWKSSIIRSKTKIRIFKTNVFGVLLYGSESWKVTKNISQKLDTFQTRCLRRILKIFWPNKITNEECMKEHTQLLYLTRLKKDDGNGLAM